MPQVAIVILNWNGQKLLQQFLPSIFLYKADADVYVADNASTDESVRFVNENYPEAKIIKLARNEGFCRGYNLALAQIRADYYVLLNNDVEVTAHWIRPMIDLMESDNTIAVCQPKILSYHHKNQFEYAGAAGGFIDKHGYPFCRGRIFETIEQDHGQYDDTRQIAWASGACFFVKASVYHDLQGLDEDFFAHMEEIDLCWRIKSAGYNIMYCGQSTVYHQGASTLSKSNPHKTFLNFRNGLYLLHKNLPSAGLPLAIFTRLILDGIAGIKYAWLLDMQNVWAIVRAHLAYYKAIPLLQRKRRLSTHLKTKAILENYSIAWQYFIRRITIYQNIK